MADNGLWDESHLTSDYNLILVTLLSLNRTSVLAEPAMPITISEQAALAAQQHIETCIAPMAGNVDAAEVIYKFQLQAGIDLALKRNPYNIEAPWYLPWNIALLHLIQGLVTYHVSPQMTVRSYTAAADKAVALSEVTPDFTVFRSRIITAVNPPISVWHELILVENKPNVRERDRLALINTTAKQLRRQVHHLFCSDAVTKVMGIISVGEYWKWFTFMREEGTPSKSSTSPIWKYFLDHPNLVRETNSSDIFQLGTEDSDREMENIRDAILLQSL
ncbi:hypothetical protein FPV67DRAFT_424641 [Lyophyllum atratum]|nr:hypothetical protein FPV67DRAFT_424641 [Lyophyllum atratum]